MWERLPSIIPVQPIPAALFRRVGGFPRVFPTTIPSSLIIILLKLLSELAPLLSDDESDQDEETMNMLLPRKDYRALNHNLNMLVRHGEAFSSRNFLNIIIVHEAIMKTLFYKSKRLCEESEKLLKEHAMKMEVETNECYDTEAKIAHEHARKETQIKSVKRELMFVKSELVKIDDEMFLVKGFNFEINKMLVKIIKAKDASHVDYIFSLLDAKLQPMFLKLSIIEGVTNSDASLQQGIGGGNFINIENPYVVQTMERKLEFPKKIVIVYNPLGQTMEKKLEVPKKIVIVYNPLGKQFEVVVPIVLPKLQDLAL
ncbi:unnamed protein product [Lactuca saligna]|uniref:Uncharacterized protein n=1 Tax=Lactuca saligna TaxID=75948 RepID=A0AA35YMR4_LACSI|nr:unnamed protein product [Lactuca saligna]